MSTGKLVKRGAGSNVKSDKKILIVKNEYSKKLEELFKNRLIPKNYNINYTYEFLNEVSNKLKTEFIGIDKEIDQIINAIKPWLFFRKTLGKPLIVNIFGLTGCGKTMVVNRLLELLSLKHITTRINGSELNDMNPLWFLTNGSLVGIDHPIIILDEFQNYRSKTRDGDEIEKYYSTLWDFIDSGIIKCRGGKYDFWKNSYFSTYGCIRVLRTLSFLNNKTFKHLSFKLTESDIIRIKKAVNYEDNSDYDKSESIKINGLPVNASISDEVLQYINGIFDEQKIKSDTKDGDIYYQYTIKPEFVEALKTVLKLYDIPVGNIDLNDFLYNLSFQDFYSFIDYAESELIGSSKMPSVDFSKSLIFVIANLDEAYYVHDNFNPDITADEFYKMTKNINVVDIREALHKRFRVEQISRLGTTYIIYPSLKSSAYKEIIAKNLDLYSKQIKELLNINLIFDKTINNIIYKESVFPTLGVRNVLTGINELIKSTFASTMLYKKEKNIECDTIEYKYKTKKIVASFFKNNKKIESTSHNINIRLDSLRNNRKDENQAVVGVHESGHAIVYVTLFKKLPAYVLSVTADSDYNGFVFRGSTDNDDYILNKQYLVDDVTVLLAGRAAEIVVFGDEYITQGASSDLKNANKRLFEAYRELGFDNDKLVFRDITPRDNSSLREGPESEIGVLVEQTLQKLMTRAIDILTEEKELLLNMGNYLSSHTNVSQNKFKAFIKKYSNIDITSIENSNVDVNYGYRDKLKSELELLKKINNGKNN